MKLSRLLLVFSLLAITAYLFTARNHKHDKHHKVTVHIDSDEIEQEIDESMEAFEAKMENFEVDMQEVEVNMEEMAAGLAAVIENRADGKAEKVISTVDFRDLKAMLPERLLRMDRENYSGERSGIKGLQIAAAEADYKDEDRTLEVKLVDGGGLSLAKIVNAGWSMVDVDKEDRYGYERTTMIDGNKAFEKYNSKSEQGELVLVYKDRFILTLEGRGLEEGDLRKVLNTLDLNKLDDL